MPFTVTMPKLSPTMETGSIAKWHKKEGEHVKAGDVLLEVSTDKATVEHSALDEGWLRKILVTEGKEAAVNEPIAIFSEEEAENIEGFKPEGATEKAVTPEVKKTTVVAQQPVREEARVFASPLAKKIAKERGIDLSQVQGTGPSQRIVSRDLESVKKVPAVPQLPSGTFEELPLSPIRKVIAQRLQEAKATIPHFYVQQAIDAEKLVALREQLSNLEVKISINDCMIRACALALREHPNINCGFNVANQTIIQFKTIDISVAVNVESGLITPIVPLADTKSLQEISREIRALAKKAKEGKLQPREFQGGSFTISNLGMFGVTDFQAIINPPQAAILAVSGIHNQPVIREGAIVPGKIMNVTLSVDHRVIDGVQAAEFIKSLQKIIENPVSLLL